jgi:cbb3-type cytochrome oxidase maturation protein
VGAFFILIGISILVAGSFLVAFLWSVKSGQYDDDYTPSIRILFDDTKATPASKKTKTQQKK